jgi:hypothetical protein
MDHTEMNKYVTSCKRRTKKRAVGFSVSTKRDTVGLQDPEDDSIR